VSKQKQIRSEKIKTFRKYFFLNTMDFDNESVYLIACENIKKSLPKLRLSKKDQRLLILIIPILEPSISELIMLINHHLKQLLSRPLPFLFLCASNHSIPI